MKIIKYPNNLLSVDPGFNTGWAYWEGGPYPLNGSIYKRKGGIIERLGCICSEFLGILQEYKPIKVIMEDQWFNEYSMKSLTSVKSGSFKKLTWLTGALLYCCYEESIDIETIPPIKWKGNLNDNAVRMRIKFITGMDYSNPHIADAVGIGLHTVGKFINIRGNIE